MLIRLLLPIGLLLHVAALAGAAAQPPERQRCFNPDPDIAACTAIIQSTKETPQNLSEAFDARGSAYAKKGQYDRAIQDYDEAIKLNASDAEEEFALRARAYVYSKKGQYDRAIQDFDAAIKLKPGDSYAVNARAYAIEQKSRYERQCFRYLNPTLPFPLTKPSIAVCTAIIQSGRETKEKLARAFESRGLAYQFGGEYDRTIQDEDEAIRLDPHAATAFYYRGNAYKDKKQFDLAISDYNEAIELAPSFAYAYRGRGEAYQGKGEYRRAVEDFDKSIKLFPIYYNAEVYYDRGLAFRALGDQGRADEDFARFKQLAAERRNNRLANQLFPPLMMFGLMSPFLALVAGIAFYAFHSRRVEPERRIPAVAYALIMAVCGAVAGFLGWALGIREACFPSTSNNLCGLWGYFVTGPISLLLAILLVGSAVHVLIRPAAKS